MNPRFNILTLYLSVLLAVSTSSPAWSQDDSWTMDKLMLALSTVRSVEARFTETRTSSLFFKSFTISGELIFNAPDHLEKITEEPYQERLLITSDRLDLIREDEFESQTVAIDDRPLIRIAVDSVRLTLAGSQSALIENYNFTLSGTMKNWKLQLVPTRKELLKHIERIIINGNSEKVERVETLEVGGDKTLLILSYQ